MHAYLRITTNQRPQPCANPNRNNSILKCLFNNFDTRHPRHKTHTSRNIYTAFTGKYHQFSSGSRKIDLDEVSCACEEGHQKGTIQSSVNCFAYDTILLGTHSQNLHENYPLMFPSLQWRGDELGKMRKRKVKRKSGKSLNIWWADEYRMQSFLCLAKVVRN